MFFYCLLIHTVCCQTFSGKQLKWCGVNSGSIFGVFVSDHSLSLSDSLVILIGSCVAGIQFVRQDWSIVSELGRQVGLHVVDRYTHIMNMYNYMQEILCACVCMLRAHAGVHACALYNWNISQSVDFRKFCGYFGTSRFRTLHCLGMYGHHRMNYSIVTSLVMFKQLAITSCHVDYWKCGIWQIGRMTRKCTYWNLNCCRLV